MSTRNYVEEFEYGDSKGLDTTSPLSMIAPGFLREARNVDVGTAGGYSKRKGYTTQLSAVWAGTLGNLSIRNGIEYNKSDGSEFTILYGTDNGSDGRIGKVDAGGVVDILTGISAINRLAFVQFEDRLLGFNGDSVSTPFIFEGGAGTRELGIAGPVAGPTVVELNEAGALLNEGSYLIAYTYVIKDNSNGTIIAESSPSPLTTEIVTSGNNALDVTVVASAATTGPGQTLSIRIYRSVVAGSVLFLDRDELANANATYRLTNADTALELIQMPLDNSQLKSFNGYAKARFPTVARNRLFIAHDSKNEVRFSKIGQEGPLPESFPAVSFSSVEGRRGSTDMIVGITQVNGVPIILKQRSIGRLEEVGLPEITNAEDPVTYVYREINDSVGVITHFAAVQVFDELVFLGRDNIYATNGGSPRPIANTIQATLKELDIRASKAEKITMVNDTKNRRIYISLFELTIDVEPNFILVGNYEQYPNFRWTFYTEGSNSTTHPGIRAGSMFQLTSSDDGTLDMYFGNTDKDGQYFRLNDGNNDNTKGIFMRIVTRPYALAQPLVTKLYKNTRIFVEAADDTYDFEFCSIFDLSSEEEFCKLFTITGVGNNWDEHNWVDDAETEADPLIWSGEALKELKYDPHRKAKFMQLVFKQEDADAPATFLGWGVSGSIFGPSGLNKE